MSDVSEVSEAPVAPQQSRKRRNVLIIAGAVVVVAVGVGTYLAVSGSSPAPVTVHGSLDLGLLAAVDTAPNATPGSPTAGDPCSTVPGSGYDDIAPGTTVTVGGSTGQPLGVGALAAGHENAQGYCEYDFSVQVPGGQSAYTVTISHRGTTTFTPAQVAAGVALTLGS